LSSGLSSNGAATIASYDKNTTYEHIKIRTHVVVNDVTSIFGIGKKDKYNMSFGTLATIKCANKTLDLHSKWDGTTTLPSVSATATIPFDFVAGRKYFVEFIKNSSVVTVRLTDSYTMASVEVTGDSNVLGIDGIGRSWGAPSLIFISGDVKFLDIDFVAMEDCECDVLVVGDSITEGYNLANTGEMNKRWAYQLKQLVPQTVIAGRGGGDSFDLSIRYEMDISKFKAKYMIIALGTNDTSDFNYWKTNVMTAINKASVNGTIPVLTTLPPHIDNKSVLFGQINSWIRSSGYKYVDFAEVLTTDSTNNTWKSGVSLSDRVHPNATGHDLMFKRLKMDVPELFD
jgi:lysophospholipase L1-like esterase